MTALADLLDTASTTVTTAPPAMVGRGRSQTGAWGQDRPEGRVLAHERRYWQSTATVAGVSPMVGSATVMDTIAATVLMVPPHPARVDEWLRRVPGLSDLSVDGCDRVRAWLASLYPGVDPEIAFGALEPDRLAEHLVATLLADRTRISIAETLAGGLRGPDAARWVRVCTRAAAHLGASVGDVVTRLCVAHPDTLAVAAIQVAPSLETPAPLVAALDHLAHDPDLSTAHLQMLADALPPQSQLWADIAVVIGAALVTRHRHDLDTTDTAEPIRLAMSLNNLSNRLSGLGRREDALAASTEAVQVYRELAAARPDAFLPDLAMSLNNLSNRLSGLGRREDALAASTEAVQVYRELAAARPDAFLPDLAMSLNNLSAIGGPGGPA
jgi:hypothetical protein